ncbi:hypothetical protein Rhal01_02110 [Rubritalea halochordaticola]|uniref:Carrier domain-containing protein n=1 Tax=Rubritalea halochordaticola TaxID=714537 RepID=A0ABP9UZQ4_9BACT
MDQQQTTVTSSRQSISQILIKIIQVLLGALILITSCFSGVLGVLLSSTIALLIAIRNRESAPPQQHYTEKEVFQIVTQEAQAKYDIAPAQLGQSLSSDIRVSPGEIANLLDDLSIDYDFPISYEDRRRCDTLLDIISLINSRSTAPAE